MMGAHIFWKGIHDLPLFEGLEPASKGTVLIVTAEVMTNVAIYLFISLFDIQWCTNHKIKDRNTENPEHETKTWQ